MGHTHFLEHTDCPPPLIIGPLNLAGSQANWRQLTYIMSSPERKGSN